MKIQPEVTKNKDEKILTDLVEKQVELNDVKQIMVGNIDKIIVRGDDLNELHDSCDNLELKAAQFQTNAKKVERLTFCRNIKYQLLIGISAALFFVSVISFVLVYFFIIKH